MPEHAAIAFEDVSKRFGDAAPALAGVSFTVKPREFLAIVGASGSGKTTLLKLINRLSEPTAGAVRVGGVEVQTLDPIALRRRIGYVFQDIGLFPHMTVAENIAITPRLLGWDQQRWSRARRRAARPRAPRPPAIATRLPAAALRRPTPARRRRARAGGRARRSC